MRKYISDSMLDKVKLGKPVEQIVWGRVGVVPVIPVRGANYNTVYELMYKQAFISIWSLVGHYIYAKTFGKAREKQMRSK